MSRKVTKNTKPALCLVHSADLPKSAPVAAPASMTPVPRRLTLSLCMIAKDEEENIGAALASAAPFVDELIVVDTGSSDRTVEIARSAGAQVYFFPWTQDFSAARNVAIEHATSDWIISLDADERIDPNTGANLRKLIEKPLPFLCAYGLLIRSVHDKEEVQLFYNSYGKRLFPRHPRVRWQRPIHEQVSHLDDDTLLRYTVTDEVVIYHYGYLKEIWDKKGKEQRNRDLLLAAIAAQPDDPFNYYNLGQEYYGQQKFAEALPNFLQCIKLARQQALALGAPIPNYTAYAYALATGCCVETREFDRGIAIGEDGRRLHDYADLHCNLGSCYLGKRDVANAVACYEKALSWAGKKAIYSGDVGSSTWRPWQNMGDAYALVAQHQQAVECYQNALRYEPNRPLPKLHAARCLLMLGDWTAAQTYLREVLALWPDNEEANVGLIEALISAGDKQTAYDRLDELVRQNPENLGYRLRLAQLLVDEGEEQVALQVFLEGLRQGPTHHLFYERLGALLTRLQRYADAANAYRMALTYNASSLPARAGLEAAEIMETVAVR